jgi:predicted lipoprotein with Yx(FWY)xxD motif
MSRSRSLTFLSGAAVIPLTVAAIAGCGSGGSNASGSTAPPKTASGRPATVGAANTSLGKVLVSSQGRTLYLFKKDKGTKSACSGACASAWPPLRTNGKPTVGSGLKASMVGTAARSDGARQVTYNGHPLYRFTGDQKAGQTNGQGLKAFGASWFALSSAGNQASGKPSGSGGGSGGY